MLNQDQLTLFKKFMTMNSLDKIKNDAKLGLSCYSGIRHFKDWDPLRSMLF